MEGVRRDLGGSVEIAGSEWGENGKRVRKEGEKIGNRVIGDWEKSRERVKRESKDRVKIEYGEI